MYGSAAIGWGAQTTYAKSPDLATLPLNPDLEPDDPNYMLWSIDQSRRTPYLWAAVAFLLNKNEELGARLAALEGA